MNIFGLVGMVEALAGPGAFERAVDAADDEVDALAEPDTELRAPGCACHLEAGDSPCPVHGDDDQ